MGKLVLRDGRVLDLTAEQSQRLGIVILLSRSDKKQVRVGEESFTLEQIVTDPEEIALVTQQRLLNVNPIPVKSKKKRKVQELA